MRTSNGLAMALAILGGIPMAAWAATPAMPMTMNDREGVHVGAGMGTVTFGGNEGAGEDPFQGYLVTGWRPSRYFSIEGRIGNTFSSVLEIEDPYDFDDWGIPKVEFRATHIAGVYVRGWWPVLERLDLYAQIGYTHARITGTVDDGFGHVVSDSDSQGSVSYAVGASWLFGRKFSLDFEYQPVIVSGDIWDLDGFNASIRMRF